MLLGIFHRTLLLFYFFIFLSTDSSSCVKDPSLMLNCLLIILVTVSWVTFVGFSSKFSKCCFHRCIRSRWLVAFSLSFAVLFLLPISFTVCHAILDCLSWTKSLILSIWFCVYSVRSFYNALKLKKSREWEQILQFSNADWKLTDQYWHLISFKHSVSIRL